MTEATTTAAALAVPKPVKGRRGPPPRKAKPVSVLPPAANDLAPVVKEAASKFDGMTEHKCPTACMQDGTCIISTVNVCKHPVLAADSGCGPVTMENRVEAKKWLARKKIDQ